MAVWQVINMDKAQNSKICCLFKHLKINIRISANRLKVLDRKTHETTRWA